MIEEGELAVPDVLVFEVLALLRRAWHRGAIRDERAAGAISDLGELPIQLLPSLPPRRRAWALRRNLTAADALFVALAESLDEPLATKAPGAPASGPGQAMMLLAERPPLGEGEHERGTV
jgi:predicted nucleic acid-binding protein